MKMRLQQAFFNSSQGPQHREIGFPISTDNASWGVGPNTEKLDFQFLQTMQVGVWAPTQRNWISNFYRQCKLGCGPQQREFRKEILQAMRVGVWAPTQKLTISQLTIMCKLGWYNDKVILFL
ncbi:hypothetical protein W284_00253 [Staphylococcus aureus DAR3163]|nr:hypothetical protein W284_00253 [Staphylococcus aureus DAR3163]